MDTLLAQVKAAHRRLVMEQFVRRLVWCLTGALAVAAIAIAAPKVLVVENLPAMWAQYWLIGGAAAALITAGVWTAVQRRSSLEAAIEIDRRYGLRERVSSSLSLPESALESEAGQALMNDAVHSVGRIEIGEKFHVRPPRNAWLPLAPAVIAFCLMAFVGNKTAMSTTGATPITPEAQKEQTKRSIEDLRKKLEEQKKEAEKKGLEDKTGVLKQVMEGTKNLNNEDLADRKKSTVKLNELSKQLEQRRQQLGDKNRLQKELEAMKDIGAGPADKAAKALQEGDWKKAINELKKMQEQLAKGEMPPEKAEQLAKQLEQMQKKLQAAADAHKQKMEDLQKQIEQQKQQGNQQQAQQLQQQLDKMQQNQPQMNQLQQMAQQMQQARQAMQQGDQQQAAQAMQQMQQQLQQMQQQNAEMEMLDGAMEQIEVAKQQMGCQQCQGQGCEACQGMGQGLGMNEGPPGMGMGKGQGKGPRPDEENPTNLRDTRVKHDPKNGASVITGEVEGPNIKGDVMQSIKDELSSGVEQEAEALSEERLPRPQRDHAQEFFSKIRADL
ncbi:Chromosome partition protein Smc [Posidoniimonas polymericola]|uniref:Chromosome partition protein Smc n=1 Tax=Posidoniimonas polymericola TaxID=2528002 RepID=A0A5C5YU04_9BACT|nr:hypothetical protein [Posidoniimonas polymericola]TWT78291.1 Chromosome partition protein Smc [Posidoniimonas polymericola]